MKKLFFMLALVAMSVLSFSQDNQLVWANGRLLYGTPVAGMDSLTYDEMEDVDTLHLLLPRPLEKVVHDTVVKTEVIHDTLIQTQVVHDTIIEIQTQIVHDTVYIETDCGDNTPSAGIGVFSVSADKQVTFSKGNLQYTQSTNTWSFASAQWEVVGTDNVIGGSMSSDPTYGDKKEGTGLADKVDLFGWSGSIGSVKFGVSTSKDYNVYSGSLVDWGTNKIGADAPNTWRTLTYDEWIYLLNNRPNASSLRGIAQVNGVNGLVLLPDYWTCPNNITFISGLDNNIGGATAYAQHQTFNAQQWSLLEESGAVFLPAAGYRSGSYVASVQNMGWYWSSSEINNCYENYFHFHSQVVIMSDGYANGGHSVRLVKDL